MLGSKALRTWSRMWAEEIKENKEHEINEKKEDIIGIIRLVSACPFCFIWAVI